MDRFTIRNSDGSVSQPTNMKWAEAFERLAEYEDTGLSPEVCRNYKLFEDEAIAKGVTFARIVELMNAEVKPVERGHWMDGNRCQPCSNCKKNGKKSWNYCPNCGADMRAAMGEANK